MLTPSPSPSPSRPIRCELVLCVRRPSVRDTLYHRVIWLADEPAARLAVANDNMAEVSNGFWCDIRIWLALL
jgi:hypothetical protein